ncbi:MAG: peptide ABC transporter permease, partial [Desulfobulbaceae bacterium]|nr:peptide ABC transporter permease [Desulfobulbaceae bacterium]
ILVVLVSVIYPSKVAAQIAIPDVNKSWTLPEPRGNILKATLPFLMKFREHRGIGGYLIAYFAEHQDVSHGLFSVGEIAYPQKCPLLKKAGESEPGCTERGCCENVCLCFHMDMWLAPFDFGIMQAVEIAFVPSEGNPGFLELRLQLVRKAGEANTWRRINKTFLHDLRRQLLVWRSLDESALGRFAKRLDSAEKERAFHRGREVTT